MDARKALKGCHADDTVILLAHQPNAAKIVLDDDTINKSVDLILSGRKASILNWKRHFVFFFFIFLQTLFEIILNL